MPPKFGLNFTTSSGNLPSGRNQAESAYRQSSTLTTARFLARSISIASPVTKSALTDTPFDDAVFLCT